MTINGVSSPVTYVRPNAAPARPAAPSAPAAPAAAAQAAKPESALWSVLSAEERAFFLDAQAMGPISYGPGARTLDAPLGQRLDVRA